MKQSLDTALCATSTPLYEAALARLRVHHEQYQQAKLPMMALAEKSDDVAAMTAMAKTLAKGAARILILGTGGSSLGAQVLAQVHGVRTLAGQQSGPQLIFVDNLDAQTYARLLADELESTRFFVVSKSGNTSETMMQLGGALLALKAADLDPAAHIAGIAGLGDNALRTVAAHYGVALLDHEDEIGGRFSAFSNVGLLPAIWAGADPMAVRAGASQVMADLQGAAQDFAPLQGAALHAAHIEAGRNMNVMMAYADCLERFSVWYRQLWAESLGKQGRGSTPINALGSVDQHSQLQLYLEGPDDKFYTFVTHMTRGSGTRVPDDFDMHPASAGLVGRTMGDLLDAEARGTLDALVAVERPVRHIALDIINDESIGQLMMHFQLETIYTANILGVNAFDQPAVEAGKQLAQGYLESYLEDAS